MIVNKIYLYLSPLVFLIIGYIMGRAHRKRSEAKE